MQLKEKLEFYKKTFSTEWGEIDYCHIKTEKYPDGLLLFMGSYVYKKYRGHGKFTGMVVSLFSMFPKGTAVQVPLENKKLVPMFERMGFETAVEIEYWGKPTNCKLMQGKI